MAANLVQKMQETNDAKRLVRRVPSVKQVEKMIALANGYSNFERFRNRAMYCENYFESYSKEKLPNTVKRTFPKKKTGRK